MPTQEPVTGSARGRRSGAPSRLLVLLGPDSDVGRAVLAGRRDRARHLLAAWQARAAPRRARRRGRPPRRSRGHSRVPVARGPAARPRRRGRHPRRAHRRGAPRRPRAGAHRRRPRRRPAARRARLAPPRPGHRRRPPREHRGDARHRARGHRRRPRPRRPARRDDRPSSREECTQQARHDLGIGAVHLPEAEVLGIAPGTDPMAVLAQRCRPPSAGATPARGRASGRSSSTGSTRSSPSSRPWATPPTSSPSPRSPTSSAARGVRVAARGSGAGSLVNHLLGISGVDPIRHRLLMERFCSPLRAELPDIDVDVESARRTEIYEAVLDRFGGERVTCVSMMDTYKVRHAVRDVGAALGLPPTEVDEIAKAFPHIRARDARHAIADLPELRSRGLDSPRLAAFFDLVEALDGLPRHIALHPCGVVLSNSGAARPHPGRGELAGVPDEPVRQGRRRDPGLPQARRPRHPHAVGDGPRRRRGRAGRRGSTSTSTTRRRCRTTTRPPTS